jgi:hypothetical protein
MPVRRLPSKPNLDHLRHQAKDLLKHHAARDLAAAQRIREFHPRFAGAADDEIFAAQLKLSDAQLTIAREAGFQSWPRLKRHIEQPRVGDPLNLPHHERIGDARFRRAVDLLDTGDADGLRAYLKQHPQLVNQRVVFEGWNYFQNPSLLEFVAGNPVRRKTMPENIVKVAMVILDAGAEKAAIDDTLALVATGSWPRECGVQLALIELLCDHGANLQGAIRAAALHGEHQALLALIARGARVDLPVAAALGRVDEFRQLLPSATPEDRHLSLALASQFGQIEIVRMLLDAGENPNRYNPVGGHSHGTPLHQAAGFGHDAVVRLLVKRGARLDMKDILWHDTPAGWARHEGKTQIEEYLRQAQESRVSRSSANAVEAGPKET